MKKQLVAFYSNSKACSSRRVPSNTVFISELTSSGTAVSDDRHKGFSFFGNDLPQGLGSFNAAFRNQVHAGRVQWNHATLDAPHLSSFLQALGRDMEIPGITIEMVLYTFSSSVTTSFGRLN